MKPPDYLKISQQPMRQNGQHTVVFTARFVRWRFALMVARMGLGLLRHAAGVMLRGVRA
jgi:hypothetical protein